MAKVNILVLHRIVKEKPQSFEDVTISVLNDIVSRSKANLITVDEIVEKKNNRDGIALTFDDGFSSDFEFVYPLLTAVQRKATFFIVTDWLGKPGYLNKNQLIEMSKAGMQIGSHSKSHPNFLEINKGKRGVELNESRKLLEDLLGIPISTFSVPYGFENKKIIQEVFSAGYDYCCNSRHGLANVNNKVFPRNSINKFISDEKMKKILQASLVTRVSWVIEDIIKSRLKKISPGLYLKIRTTVTRK